MGASSAAPRPTHAPASSRGSGGTPAKASWFGAVGDIVNRGAIPLWIGAGAAFKLYDRDPNLLPLPVRNIVFSIHDRVGIGTTEQFLEFAMRSIIAIEIIAVAGMVLLPRISRWLALAMLALFITILGTLMSQGALTCGCFGAKGPPPVVVLGIDSALFVLAAIFGPTARAGRPLIFVTAAAIGTALAFGVPSKSGEGAPVESPQAPSQQSPPATRSAAPPTPTTKTPTTDTAPPTPTTKTPTTDTAPRSSTPPPPGPSTAAATEWPAPPAKTKGFYAPRFNTWVGKPLSSQEMMLMLKRPLPAGLDQGKWHIVFYRVDCEHCQDLINTHFAGTLAVKTLLVKVPDASPGRDIGNDATDVVHSELLRIGSVPDYVIGTPIVVTVVDGQVKAVCDKTDDLEALMTTLDAE